ncbi:MAG: site-2 protease family protein [Nocardioidaceae bacterium]
MSAGRSLVVRLRAALSLLVFLAVMSFAGFSGGGLYLSVRSGLTAPVHVTVGQMWPVCVLLAVLGLPHSVVLHELGHAWAARRRGMQVSQVQIGRGSPLISLRVAGVPVSFHSWPFEGRTRFTPSDHATVRELRGVVRAGPLVHAWLVAAALLSTVVLPPLAAAGAAGFAMLNLCLLLGNMADQPPAAGTLGTDGWQLGELRALPAEQTHLEIKQGRGRPYLTGDPDIAAERLLRRLSSARGLTLVQLRNLRWQLAYQCCRQGRFTEGADLFEALAAREPSGPTRVALAACWADAVVSAAVAAGHTLPPAVQTRCADAVSAARGMRGVKHSASLLSLVQGQPREALVLAEETLDEEDLQVEERAIVAATIALALAGVGEHAQARVWLEEVPVSCPLHAAASRAAATAPRLG